MRRGGDQAWQAVLPRHTLTLINVQYGNAPATNRMTHRQKNDAWLRARLGSDPAGCPFVHKLREVSPAGQESLVIGASSFKLTNPGCGHCGKSDAVVKLLKCARCKNTAHCSREYQGAAWPVHKRTGKEMKAARKKEQQAGSTKATPKEGAAESQKPTSAMHVDATAVGSVCVFVSYGEAPCMMIFTSRCDQQVPPQMVFKLSDVDSGVGPVPNELNLLLSCGTIPSLTRVKRLLDDISRMVEQHGDPFLRNIQQLRLPGAGCTPLEWAARKGNFEIAEFLCKHTVTAATVKIGAPVACRVGLLHGPGGARQDAGLLRC